MKKQRGSMSYLTKEGFKNVWVNRLMSIASIAVLMSCLVMIGSTFMVLVNVEHIMKQIEGENVIMVYLDDDTTDEEALAVREQIEKLPSVVDCEFTDKDTAFKEAIADLGTDAQYFANAQNRLPDLYKVSIDDMQRLEATSSALREIDNVNTVRDNKNVAEALIQIRSAISYISFGVIAVLLVISLFIIANTIRITMFNRRLEINIMKSVGATNWFIRWPFVIEGMLLGFISALVSLGAVWGIYEIVKSTIASLLSSIGNGFEVVPFAGYALYVLAAFVVIGIASGGIGSMVSIQKYLKEHGGVVYDEAE